MDKCWFIFLFPSFFLISYLSHCQLLCFHMPFSSLFFPEMTLMMTVMLVRWEGCYPFNHNINANNHWLLSEVQAAQYRLWLILNPKTLLLSCYVAYPSLERIAKHVCLQSNKQLRKQCLHTCQKKNHIKDHQISHNVELKCFPVDSDTCTLKKTAKKLIS